MATPKKVIVHHSAVSREQNGKQFEAINNYHRSINFPKSKLGFYGGYQYLIEPDGELKQYRLETEVGAHTSQKSMNYKSIGVCLTGNFDTEDPTPEQLGQLQTLLAELRLRYPEGIEVEPHRKYATYKTCCGVNFTQEMLDALNLPNEEDDLQLIINKAMALNSEIWVMFEESQKRLNEVNEAFRQYRKRQSQ